MRVAIPFITLVIVLLAGCSSSTLNVGDTQAPGVDDRSASWDPLAPIIETLPVDEALALAPSRTVGGYTVQALGTANLPNAGTLASLRFELVGGTLAIYTDGELSEASLYVSYDAAAEHVVEAVVDRDDALGLTVVEPGVAALGVAGIGGKALDTSLPLATVSFADGAETATRSAAAISQVPRTAVTDLAAVYEGEGTATLSWHERHNGDYDVDGLVGVSDLTPIGIYYDQQVVETDPEYAYKEVVDGTEDGFITVADISPIGQSYGSYITGYNIYRMAYAETPPTTDDTGWVKLLNATEPDGPTAPREWNGIKVRVQYTAQDTPEESGNYAWYVVPTGRAGETPYEGPVSNVASTEVGPPAVSLNLEIQSPDSSLLSVDDEFYVGVRVANVEGLFSANVRFEYDSTLVEFVETVPYYTDTTEVEHTNFLVPPLFVGDDVGAAGEGYRQVGFNATQRNGVDAPQTGEGMLGYVKFRAIGSGINDSCFRFPQTTTFVYLWGATYGVAVGAPELGDPVRVNID